MSFETATETRETETETKEKPYRVAFVAPKDVETELKLRRFRGVGTHRDTCIRALREFFKKYPVKE